MTVAKRLKKASLAREGVTHQLKTTEFLTFTRARRLANEKLYSSKMLIGALYRVELARELTSLGYGIEKTHADGRFEIAGVSREVIDAFSTRRAEIETAMDGRGLGTPAENQRAAQRAALMTRAAKRDVDRAELREMWQRQADGLGFDARGLAADAMERSRDALGKDRGSGWDAASDTAAVRQGDLFDPQPQSPVDVAMAWAVEHLSEREAVFAKTDLLAAALAWKPGSVTIGEAEAAAARLEKAGKLHPCGLPAWGESLTTDRAVADEKETIALSEAQVPPQVLMAQGAVGRSRSLGPSRPQWTEQA